MESSDLEAVEKLHQAYERLMQEVNRVIIGQHQVVEELMISLLAGGHCLLVGVPGLAKTLIVHTLADTLNLSFNRVQFTPDLMPADITGTDVIQEDKSTGNRDFKFLAGPIFSNVVLADEINRTPPKTQAALLQGMQERTISAGTKHYQLPRPFFVLATQNPIEQEGTYPLPEAQLDRFLMKIIVKYPTREEERLIYKTVTGDDQAEPEATLTGEEVLELQHLVRRVPISDFLVDYTMDLIRATRRDSEDAPEFINRWVLWGAGPRGGQSLILAAKARAALYGRPEVSVEDLQTVAKAVLRHRIVLSYNAESEGQTADTVIERLIEETPLHQSAAGKDGQFERILKS